MKVHRLDTQTVQWEPDPGNDSYIRIITRNGTVFDIDDRPDEGGIRVRIPHGGMTVIPEVANSIIITPREGN
jgi:hypothetical protein